jgi:hypothetical protein
MRLAEHIACIGVRRYRILVGIAVGMIALRGLGIGGRIILKWELNTGLWWEGDH